MPLPYVPDGPEKPPTLAGTPGAPAAASPQSALLAELWGQALRSKESYVETSSDRHLAALEADVGALVATLHHLYGQDRLEALGRVQEALARGEREVRLL